MNFRRYRRSDFKVVRRLYQRLLSFQMTSIIYDYFYFRDGAYRSFVIEIDCKVIAHHGIIYSQQFVRGKQVLVATLSGAMVDPRASGVFMNMLKSTLNEISADVIVAFPNNNAEPFYRHILKFDSIEQSYFSVDLDELNITADWPESGGEKVNIPIEYLRKRFDEHPQYNYQDFTLEDSTFIYKIYRGQVDILYYSQLKKDFQYFLEHLKNEGFRKANIISPFGSFLKNIGFKYQSYNKFYYKNINGNLGRFPVQMFNSDVF